MSHLREFYKLVPLLACLFVWQPQVRAEICNRVVAVVNNEIITLYELNSRLKELTGLEPAVLRMKDEKGYLNARRRVLDLLIDERIATEKIQELGIKVTQKEVDSAIERIKQENSLTHEDLVHSLEAKGLTYETYQENIKRDLERMRLINFEVKSKIIIREEEIEAYYNEHKSDFSTAERVHLAAIFIKKQDQDDEDSKALMARAEQIQTKLRNGADFGQLAKEFSEGPGAEEGGDLGFFNAAQLDPELTKRINGLSDGAVSEPIVRPAGIQIVKLISRERGNVKSLQEAKEAIYTILYRQEVNKRFSAWIKELREKAYTKIIF